MLEKILKLYVTSTISGAVSPVPHLFGPPGCGKSTVVKQAADLLGVKLHTINVSRISPLELEGVQMPTDNNSRLSLLTATFWTQLKDGDILLLDEFLRGFPEVYNGLLDILTSREVGGYKLPNVFIIAASNTTIAYDKALEDRLLHLKVPDPRKSKKARDFLYDLFIQEAGLLPSIKGTWEIDELFDQEVLPTYEVLDEMGTKRALATKEIKGTSIRNLLGQIKLREIQSSYLKALLNLNNARAFGESKPQYVIIAPGAAQETVEKQYKVDVIAEANERGKLTPIQQQNFLINKEILQLMKFKQEASEDDAIDPDEELFL